MLTIKHYRSVLEVLWEIRAEYNKIGIEFGLSPSDVKAIEKSNHFHNKAISKEELVIVLESNIIDRKKLANVVQRTVFLTGIV